MSPSARGAAAAAADWPTYNGPLSGDRYSPLSQITPASVSQLREKCAFTMPDSAHVLALDARAGKELWRSASRMNRRLFTGGPALWEKIMDELRA